MEEGIRSRWELGYETGRVNERVGRRVVECQGGKE